MLLHLRRLKILFLKGGGYDVVIHGDKSGLAFTRGTNNLVTVQQLYQEMLAAGYQQGTKIRLMSCYAGKLNIGTAAQLSKLAGAPVAAPTGSLWIWRLGDPDAAINYGTQFQIFSNDVHEVGKMLLFKR